MDREIKRRCTRMCRVLVLLHGMGESLPIQAAKRELEMAIGIVPVAVTRDFEPVITEFRLRGEVGEPIEIDEGFTIDKVMFRDVNLEPVAIWVRKVHRTYMPGSSLVAPLITVYSGAREVLELLRDVTEGEES